MSSTAFNLLLAILLLAANAFYVAAEFALVKSRGFRIKAMVEQDRFGARLLHDMMGNIEAYLACCQLGITMASLGLGWVGEPTVAALLEPLLIPLGMSERTLHFVSFMTGFLVFSSLHIVIGEQVPKTLAIRQPMPVSQWIAYPLYLSYLVFYPLNWLLNTRPAGSCACSACRNLRSTKFSPTPRSRGWWKNPPCTAVWKAVRPNTFRMFSASATWPCPTSWFTAP